MENFLHHEEDANLLMGDEMEQIEELPPQNLNVGMVRLHETFVGGPILPNRKSFTLGGPSLPTNLWTQFLSTNQNVPKCVIPVPWVNFFSALLVSPKHFNSAKSLLTSIIPATLMESQEGVNFIPNSSC